MNLFRYTNPTSSDWNPNLYSKQIGGDLCNTTCKKKCKKNCATYCQIAKEDKTEFKEAMNDLKERRNRLKEKLKEMEYREKDYEYSRVNYLLQNKYNRSRFYKLKQGGTRRKRTKRNTKGGNWFSNSYSLVPCEKSCTDKCESQCKPICTDASFLAHDNKELSDLKNEIKILELSIEKIEFKLGQ
jgi:hypothetical protein